VLHTILTCQLQRYIPNPGYSCDRCQTPCFQPFNLLHLPTPDHFAVVRWQPIDETGDQCVTSRFRQALD